MRAERVPDFAGSAGPRQSSEPGRGGEPDGREPVAAPASPSRCGIAIRAAWRRRRPRRRARPRRRRHAICRSAPGSKRSGSDYTAATLSLRAYGGVIVPKSMAAYEMSLARYREMALAYPLVLTAQRALLEASDAEIRRGRRRPGGGAAAGLLLGEGEM